jgi:hypothetical protein
MSNAVLNIHAAVMKGAQNRSCLIYLLLSRRFRVLQSAFLYDKTGESFWT